MNKDFVRNLLRGLQELTSSSVDPAVTKLLKTNFIDKENNMSDSFRNSTPTPTETISIQDNDLSSQDIMSARKNDHQLLNQSIS